MSRIRVPWAAAALALVATSHAQDRLSRFPSAKSQAETSAAFRVSWAGDGFSSRWIDDRHVAFRLEGGWTSFDVKTATSEKLDKEPAAVTGQAIRGRRAPGRGGQYAEALHPDGKQKAVHANGNVSIVADGGEPTPVTQDGGKGNVTYGTGSWVYGEELGQNEAMGFSPNGRYLWFYRFDESAVTPQYVMEGYGSTRPAPRTQMFPKPGGANPIVDIQIYDLVNKTTSPVSTRPRAFDDGIGHYVYDIRWSPSGDELFFRRSDRRQKTMELCAASPATGTTRVIVAEVHPESYAENKLGFWPLESQPGGSSADFKNVALYEHERNGYLNYALLNFETGGLAPISSNAFDALSIVRIDLERKRIFYMAAGTENASLRQCYVIGLDGKGNRRLTDPAYDHDVVLSPSGDHFIDTAQSCESAPVVRLFRSDGTMLSKLYGRDTAPLKEAGFTLPRRLNFLAGDGKTPLFGSVTYPRHFDPSKTYPVLLQVYGGPLDPHGLSHSERFNPRDGANDYGFIVVSLQNRGTGGRGKAFRDATYRRLGGPDMDDQAAGIRELMKQPYVDASKIGVEGTSYGGYASVMLILRFPEIFSAACAASCVNDWRNYDTIYTERYMGLLEENTEGYDLGSANLIADKLRGWLMLYYGTADDNTHPENTLNLVRRLASLGKSIEVQVGTDHGHSGVPQARMLEFFLERMCGESPN